MKKSNLSAERSENARKEARNSDGRFTSEHKNSTRASSHHTTRNSASETNSKGNHRGENAKDESRDSDGRFKSNK